MKSVLALTAFLILALGAGALPRSIKTFEEFKKAFNKVYATPEEEAIRRENFLNSLKYVEEHANVSINHLSDLSLDEFRTRYLFSAEQFEKYKQARASYNFGACKITTKSHPSAMDLRSTHKITPIRNQGACGSCWAFSDIAAVESLYLSHKNITLHLSEQELVDCASAHGCHGDTLPTGFEYIRDHGLVAASAYQYNARENQCKHPSGERHKIKSYCMLNPNNDETMKKMLAQTNSAISIIIGIKDLDAFRHYDGRGVITHDNGATPNYHAVNVVGYGRTGSTDYWIIKNSWDTYWGYEGFGYFAQHVNLMGMNDNAFVPSL